MSVSNIQVLPVFPTLSLDTPTSHISILGTAVHSSTCIQILELRAGYLTTGRHNVLGFPSGFTWVFCFVVCDYGTLCGYLRLNKKIHAAGSILQLSGRGPS